MNPTLIAGAVALVLGGLLLAQCQKTDAARELADAKQKQIDEVYIPENQGLAAKLETANGEVNSCHAEIDEADRQAQVAKQGQQAAVRQLADAQRKAADDKNSLLTQLQEKIHARPIVVIEGVPDGWDPAVLSGMRALKCVQLRAAHPDQHDFPDCDLQNQDDTAGSGLTGGPAGASYPRPNAEQQLAFLEWSWRLREWGASCYADKRAIAASQAP